MIIAVAVPILVHMGEQLRRWFNRASDVATASLEDVGRGIGKARRTFFAYRSGDRHVTPQAALDLAGYLRRRAAKFLDVAEKLEDAAEREDDDG